MTPLLHLVSPAEWRAALADGAIHPTVADFVHLSAPEQVAVAANGHYAGRTDLYLLVLDPERIRVEVRWEESEPPMRFPHAYGPVPTTAVLDVLPYPPGPDGVFATPTLPPLDPAARAARLTRSIVRRAATAAVPVAGGVALRTAPVPFSYQHNALFLDTAVDAGTVVAEADRALVGLDHRAAALYGPALGDTAVQLGRRGWSVDAQAGMIARPAGSPTGRVELVDLAAVRPLWDADWRRAGLAEAAVAQLSDRYALEEAVADVRYLAVRDGRHRGGGGRPEDRRRDGGPRRRRHRPRTPRPRSRRRARHRRPRARRRGGLRRRRPRREHRRLAPRLVRATRLRRDHPQLVRV